MEKIGIDESFHLPSMVRPDTPNYAELFSGSSCTTAVTTVRFGIVEDSALNCATAPEIGAHVGPAEGWRLAAQTHATGSMTPQEGNHHSSSETKELVVFDILRDSKCAECLQELWKGDFLFIEGGRPLCLSCADLDHLVYLPRGNTALTRRARKHSALSAVVVRFSRSRGRYERQGVLIEEAALDRAEAECQADAGERRARRQRDKLRRAEQDRDLTALMTEGIINLFPGCPPEEARVIAAHTSVRGSGRVGRTSAGRTLEEDALTAAVIAAIRHTHTPYDRLLMRGYSRRDARDAIRDAVDRVMERWRCPGRG